MQKSAVNKFTIGEKYNEIGQADPKGFIKWLLTNLPDNLKSVLKGLLEHILDKFRNFDIAQKASGHFRMPWNKDTVEPDYYEKQKISYYNEKLPGIFRAMGMEDDVYRDPEIIEKAHALEEFVKIVYDEAFGQEPAPEDSTEYEDYQKRITESLCSIDMGRTGDFVVKIGGLEKTVAIIEVGDYEAILEKAGIEDKNAFLIAEGEVTRGGRHYVAVNADNETWKELVLDAALERAVEEPKIDPQTQEEAWKPEGVIPEEPKPDQPSTGQPKEPVKGKKPKYPKLDYKDIEPVRGNAINDTFSAKLFASVKPTYESVVQDLSPEDEGRLFLKIKVNADKMHSAGTGRGYVQIPYTKPPLYLNFPKGDTVKGYWRVNTDKDGNRYVTVNLSESFPVYDAKGQQMYLEDGNGGPVMISAKELCSSHFLIRQKAFGDPVLPQEEPIPKSVEVISDTTVKITAQPGSLITNESIPEGANIQTIDFDHREYVVESGAINDMPGLKNIINAENVRFADDAVTGCPFTLSEYLNGIPDKEDNEKEPYVENEMESQEKTKEPTAYVKQQLFNMDGQTR